MSIEIIVSVRAREILDSRGNPTLEVDIHTEGGAFGRAAVPSGASTGAHEAAELRDGDKKRYGGKGTLKAVENVNDTIADALLGEDVSDQVALDKKMIELDGTPNKSKLGANAILGVSLAAAHAAAQRDRAAAVPVRRRGEHHRAAGPADEHFERRQARRQHRRFPGVHDRPRRGQVVPRGAADGAEVFHSLKKVLHDKGLNTAVGDEGGFAPEHPQRRRRAGDDQHGHREGRYKVGDDIGFALDAACTELFEEAKHKGKDGYCFFKSAPDKVISSEEMIDLWAGLCAKYPILSIEDGLSEDDWAGWKKLTAKLGDKVQLVGDDLFVTNTERLKRGVAEKCGNSILVKVNQIGTLTETLEAVGYAMRNKFTAIMSHRSGETEDVTIADLAVATNCGQIKTGSASRTDRIAKYNQLLRIEEQLGTAAVYGAELRK